jgi:SAM-dependent methyltransferase
MTQPSPTSGPAAIDPSVVKDRTRAAWQGAAQAWHDWGPTIEAWLQPVTDVVVEQLRVAAGAQVLDVAAGAGEPAVTLARLVGPGGSVLAVDISPAILELATAHAAGAGVDNVATRVMDGEALDLPERSFDAAVSRLGVIYFPDRQTALREIHRVLRPGGRVAVVGITSPAANPFAATTFGVLMANAQLPPPTPGGPGPYSMGDPDVMRAALTSAGFDDVDVRIVDATLRMESAAECARFQREAFAGLDQMLSALDALERDRVWAQVASALQPFDRDTGFVSPSQFIVGAGTA